MRNISAKNYFFYCLISITVWAMPQLAFSAKTETLDSIHNSVISFIKKNFDPSTKVEIKVGLNDDRLRLHRCSQTLDVFWTPGTRKVGNTSVGVQCRGDAKWIIYVPVKVKIFKPVMVASTTLIRGQILQTNHYKMEQRDISSLVGGYITAADNYSDYVIKRPIRVGQLITPHMLQVPKMVRRGERVTLLAELGGLQVRSSGVALEDGTEGGVVRIRNSRSKRIIEGRVVSQGTVKIAM